MRTIESICQNFNIENKEHILFSNDTYKYEGIIKNDTLLLKRIITNSSIQYFELYVVYDNLYITVKFNSLKSLELMYTYLTKNDYSKVIELSNIPEIIEFHIESL